MPPPGAPQPLATLDAGPGGAWALALPPGCHDELLLAGTKAGGIAVWDTAPALAAPAPNHRLAAAPKALLQPTPPAAASQSLSSSSAGVPSAAFMVCVAAGSGGLCAGGGDDGSVSVFDLGAEAMAARFDEANV